MGFQINNGWKTNHSKTFEDKDENKSREIDIISYKSEYKSHVSLGVFFHLVI
jgi:hypothetical protein